MEPILKDTKKRTITEKEDISIFIKHSSLYLVAISARCKGETQVGGTDDEDLRIEIDGRHFGELTNHNRYFDCPAAFTGGKLHNSKETIYFFLNLYEGRHILSLFPDKTATLELLEIFKVSSNTSVEKIPLVPNITAEDGNTYPWIVFAFVDLSISTINLTLTLKKRFIDSDDVKVVIDGKIQRNFRNSDILHKFWYFIANKDSHTKQSATFSPHLSKGLHYIELWADRMPLLQEITFHNVSSGKQETIEEKITRKANEFKLDPNLMLRVARKESTLNPNAVSPVGAKGLFQLTDITIEQIDKLGFHIHDPFDIDENIIGGMMYFKWLLGIYKGDKEMLVKTLVAWNWGMNNFPQDEALDYNRVPEVTKKFVHDILGK